MIVNTAAHPSGTWYALRCDGCGSQTTLCADIQDMWKEARDLKWQIVTSLPRHYCPTCKRPA